MPFFFLPFFLLSSHVGYFLRRGVFPVAYRQPAEIEDDFDRFKTTQSDFANVDKGSPMRESEASTIGLGVFASAVGVPERALWSHHSGQPHAPVTALIGPPTAAEGERASLDHERRRAATTQRWRVACWPDMVSLDSAAQVKKDENKKECGGPGKEETNQGERAEISRTRRQLTAHFFL